MLKMEQERHKSACVGTW